MAVDLQAVLQTTGLPVTHSHWPRKQVPPLPYLVYASNGTANVGADNRVWLRRANYRIELYTDNGQPDPASEALVESALDTAGLFWQRTEVLVESENLYLVTYQVQI